MNFLNQEIGHYLIIDMGYPMTALALKNITLSVQNVLAMSYSVRNTQKVSAFGLSIINTDFQFIHKLSYLRGKYSQIEKSLSLLRQQIVTNEKVKEVDYKDLLNLALKSCTEDFQTNSRLSDRNWRERGPSKILITFVTCKAVSVVQDYFLNLLKSSPNEKVKKIILLGVGQPHSQKKFSELIEVVQVSDCHEDLEHVFRSWFLETTETLPKVNLMFPRSCPPMLIRCEMQSCILDPCSIPYGHRFYLKMDPEQGTSSRLSLTNGLEVCNYNLEIISKIALSGLCPSLLFGLPMRLHPTQSASLSFNEVQKNMKVFEELCKQLHKEDCGLIAKLGSPSQQDNMVTYFFIDSGDSELMLKSLAPSELSLPSIPTKNKVIYDPEVSHAVKTSLQSLEFIEDYQPQQLRTGLYEILKKNIKETAHSTSKKQPDKAKAVKPKKVETPNSTIISEHDILVGEYTPEFCTSPDMEVAFRKKQGQQDKTAARLGT